ncbi:Ig-like domain-containing protein [Granulosicoccus antarcticus]|nr:Ig-like domain-containing protein [Granulosicoccus antarcticus]
MVTVSGAQADGQVSSITTELKPATAFSYTAEGIEYQWGMGSNQIMQGFVADGRSFGYAMSADRVEIQRHDIPGVTTGEPCGLFVERLSDGDASRQFAADYPSDGSGTGNCDIAKMLSSRTLNRGVVDVFSNQLPDAKNIERLDYLFDYGVLAPFSASQMNLAGHVAAEKGSNNPVKMAAILSLDILGQPASYGSMMLVEANGCSEPATCYGVTDLQHQYSFLQNDFNEPQGFPVETERSHETVGMVFVSADKLGLQPGQRYYGFSFFADDVNAEEHNLLDPSSFPTDTADNYVVSGDDADIYGGLSGYFVADDISVTTGAIFNDIDGDGIRDDDEAGFSDIEITLYEDVNGNGVVDSGIDTPLGDSIDSDMSGNFVLPGLPDGNYIVEMNEQDPELPPGLINAPGTNPHPLTIAGGDSDPVNFPFINPNGNGGGSGDGATDAGAGDGGADGATDAGAGDGGADGATDAGAGDGGADGATDAGAGDGGADGATDAGAGDGGADGATDAGAGDGGADGATDAGAGDGGADGATDAGAGDGGADGATDAGAGDGGADGATDAGAGDGGATDGGADGGTDSGENDGGLNDGVATVAVDDEFEVNQGRSDTFDVLANDSGDGLTLISVSDSSNATITIIDNEVNYRPDYGFYGRDTFVYVLQDSSGEQFTGNVVVDVIRFSDLNQNDVNDYAECDCTDLTLQTGVNGSGVGSLSLFGTWVLLMGVGVRRLRRRKANISEQGVS